MNVTFNTWRFSMNKTTSTLPTIEQMTSMYLFGQLEKPNNLVDENLIRPKDLTVDYPVKASVAWATLLPTRLM